MYGYNKEQLFTTFNKCPEPCCGAKPFLVGSGCKTTFQTEQ